MCVASLYGMYYSVWLYIWPEVESERVSKPSRVWFCTLVSWSSASTVGWQSVYSVFFQTCHIWVIWVGIQTVKQWVLLACTFICAHIWFNMSCTVRKWPVFSSIYVTVIPELGVFLPNRHTETHVYCITLAFTLLMIHTRTESFIYKFFV